MNYVELSRLFREEKAKFPANVSKAKAWWDNEASQSTYSFLAQNKSLIEHEFQDLFAVLKKYDKEILLIDAKIQKLSQRANNEDAIHVLNNRKAVLVAKNMERKDFWLQCYYYAKLLESYNNAYGKVNKYGKWSEEIYQRFNTPADINVEVKKMWAQRILDDLTELAATPWHIGKIRDWVSFTNIYRIHTVFCRLTAKTALNLASEKKILDLFKSTLGWEFNISVLDTPTNVYNVLSVGLFAVRFIINSGLIVKHVFFPQEKERQGEDWSHHWYERFIQELNKRYCSLLNDFAWSGVNLLTNFGPYFNLSSAFGNGLTAGFLCFDVALLIWRRRLDEQDYLIKKHQYLRELDVSDISLLDSTCSLSFDMQIIKEQLIRLEIEWDGKNAMYWFDIAAALVLVTSFSGFILLSTYAIIPPICFFMITLGAAMYISDGSFKNYWEKKSELKHLPLDEACLPEYKALVNDELNASWNKFLMTFIKNATIPLFITAAFTVSTPVALLFTGIFIAYENGHDYFARPEPLAAVLLVTGACFISWPLALTTTALYFGYEGGRWLLEQPEFEHASRP